MKYLDNEGLEYLLSNLTNRVDNSIKLLDPSSETSYIEINKTDPNNIVISLNSELVSILDASTITIQDVEIPPIYQGNEIAIEIIETSQFSGSIEWNPTSEGTYQDRVNYQVTITLYPKPGYSLWGVPANFFNIVTGGEVIPEDITNVTNAANSGVITASLHTDVEVIEVQPIAFNVTPTTLPSSGGTVHTEILFDIPD